MKILYFYRATVEAATGLMPNRYVALKKADNHDY